MKMFVWGLYDDFYTNFYFWKLFLAWKGGIWEFLWALILLKIIFKYEKVLCVCLGDGVKCLKFVSMLFKI